jgi:hypothetical protein
MAHTLISIDEIKSQSSGATVTNAGHVSAMVDSYPQDMQAALSSLAITMTSDGEREKAFKRAGLR